MKGALSKLTICLGVYQNQNSRYFFFFFFLVGGGGGGGEGGGGGGRWHCKNRGLEASVELIVAFI